MENKDFRQEVIKREIAEISSTIEDLKNNGAGIAAEYLGICNKYNLAVSCIEDDKTASRLKDEHFSENALYYAERLMHLQSSVESFLEWLDKYCVQEHDMAVSA